jgi:hypothetical protein
MKRHIGEFVHVEQSVCMLDKGSMKVHGDAQQMSVPLHPIHTETLSAPA